MRFLKHVAQHQGERVSAENKNLDEYIHDAAKSPRSDAELAASDMKAEQTPTRSPVDPDPSIKASGA